MLTVFICWAVNTPLGLSHNLWHEIMRH